MKRRLLRVGIPSLIMLILIAGCRNAGKMLVKADPIAHADAIVILMGSISDRALQASDLYKANLAKQIIFSRVGTESARSGVLPDIYKIRKSDLVKDTLIALGVPDSIIHILPGNAVSTRMEAGIINNYLMSNPEIDTILMVSSSSHTRRASMIFKSTFRASNHSMVIICVPSIYTDFHADHWWRSKKDIKRTGMEYLKILNFFFNEQKRITEENGHN